MIRCLISDGSAQDDACAWVNHLTGWISAGVDIVQIREPGLTARRLSELTREILTVPNPRGTRIIVNDRADVAIACGAHGVHLKDGSVAPEFFARPGFLVSVACHALADIGRIQTADFVVLAPIFNPLSKKDARPVLGVQAIKQAARVSRIPVLALGGITETNAPLCLEAGAAGVAGVSYFSALPGESARSSLLP